MRAPRNPPSRLAREGGAAARLPGAATTMRGWSAARPHVAPASRTLVTLHITHSSAGHLGADGREVHERSRADDR